MSPMILCLAAVLTSEAVPKKEWRPVYTPSKPLAAAVRGQSPLADGWYVPRQSGSSQLADNGPVLPNNQFVPPVEVGPTYVTPGPVPDPVVFDGGAVYGYTTGLYAGYESVWLKPHFSSDAAFETVFPSAGFQIANQFDWDLEHSPRLWVGFTEPDGMGVQARYWQFDHGVDLNAFDPGAPVRHRVDFKHGVADLEISTGTGETLFASHDLELHVIDLEKTWHKHYCNGSLTVAGGVRYVRMDQDYEAKILNAAGVFDRFILTQHDFEGIGPTVSLLGRRRLWNTNFAAFANARLSAVYGDSSLSMVGTDDETDDIVGWSTSGNDLIPITEFQLGTEWSCRICCDTRLFLRAALEGQVWFDAGTGMNTTNDEHHNTSPQVGNLGLFGFAVGGGLTY